MSKTIRRFLWVGCVVLGLLGWSRRDSRAAMVQYPAQGHLDTEEGTIEIWFTPMTDLYPEPPNGVYMTVLSLFRLEVPDEFHFVCSWYVRPQRKGMKVSMDSERAKKGLLVVLAKTPQHWKRGEPHHVAFTWKGRNTTLFADGQPIGSREQLTGFSGKMGRQQLIIGGENPSHTRLIIHAVRLSSVARRAETLKEARPVADLATRLLDRFDDRADADSGTTEAEVISGLGGERGGRIAGRAHVVSAPRPGLALYPR